MGLLYNILSANSGLWLQLGFQSLFFPSWPLSIFCLLILSQPKFISIFWRRKCALRAFIGFYFAVQGRGLFFLLIQTKPACSFAALRGWFWRLDVFIEWAVYKIDSLGHALGAALAHLFFQAVPPLWALAWLWYHSKSFWKKQESSDLCSFCNGFTGSWAEFCSLCVSFAEQNQSVALAAQGHFTQGFVLFALAWR